VNKQFGKTSALSVFAVSIALALVLGAKLFGLY
jgi:succinate dehydrogenase / fumarate reductase cytochrome b subunit